MIIVRKTCRSNRSGRQIGKTTMYSLRQLSFSAFVVIVIIECGILQPVVSEINHNEFLAQLKVPQCRKDCLDKVRFNAIVASFFRYWSWIAFAWFLLLSFGSSQPFSAGLSFLEIVWKIKVFSHVSYISAVHTISQNANPKQNMLTKKQ